jgi:hypothetical protein
MRIFLIPLACLSIFIVTPARALCLWDCTPSEAPVCADLKAKIERDRNYPGHVTSCRKVDGQALEFMGVQAYRMVIEITATYPNGDHPCATDPRKLGCSMIMDKIARPGDSRTRQLEVMFQKTEQGWQETGRVQ